MSVGSDQITLEIAAQDLQITKVDLKSSRALKAALMLEGKTPEQACALLPMLFSLCGTAQQIAGMTAMEEALGYIPSPAHLSARQFLLQTESICEHTTRILIDWAELAGLSPDIQTVRPLRQSMAGLGGMIYAEGLRDKVGGASLDIQQEALRSEVAKLKNQIEQVVFGESAERFLEICDSHEFLQWIAKKATLPGLCLSFWDQTKSKKASWPLANLLPKLGKDFVNARMDGEAAEEFIARPTFEEGCYETGALDRQYKHPLITSMIGEAKDGSIIRLVAKLIDLAELLSGFEGVVPSSDLEKDLYHTKDLSKGLGQVEAVRGRLIHRVWMDETGEKIKRYRILAPTEWNFHPDGMLPKALVGQQANDTQELKYLARLAVMALDPCVGCDIVLQNHKE